MLRKIKSIVRNIINDNEKIQLQNGKILSELIKLKILTIKNISETEFKIFSQWGDDGIIQFLVDILEIKTKYFIEFGVEDYKEANTRFLLMNNNWSGLVMDGSRKNIEKIKSDPIYWKYDLVAKNAFITAENINDLIEDEGISGQIGLLHIDIDGNDYWIWESITVIQPVIVIVEYNSIFGKTNPFTIPYQPDFIRTKAHYSNLYAGSSLRSLCDLANVKGYSFIGCNSAGNNAYFVKNDFLKNLKQLTVEEGYVESKFREARHPNGKLNFIRGTNRIDVLKGLPVFNTETKKIEYL